MGAIYTVYMGFVQELLRLYVDYGGHVWFQGMFSRSGESNGKGTWNIAWKLGLCRSGLQNLEVAYWGPKIASIWGSGKLP